MGRWVLGAIGCAGVAFAFLHVSACGLSVDGTANALDATSDQQGLDVHAGDVVGPDSPSVDGPQPDTGPTDSGVPDADGAPPCNAFLCGTACVTSCAGCAFGTAQCNGDRTCGDCTTCSDGKNACYTCNGGTTFGLCQAMKCNVPDNQSCTCAGGDAAACPGKTQICTGGGNPLCKTCGQGGTDMKQCSVGTQCDEMMGACR